MSEGGGPRRSARIANKRQQTRGDERKPKRMKSNQSSRAPTSVESFDERLRGVVSFRAAIPVLEEYLASIQVDDDDPAFLFDWQVSNVVAFVDVVNGLNLAQAPLWLRTRPGHMTPESFMDDVLHMLDPQGRGRCGWVCLAPNTVVQCMAIAGTLVSLQNDPFLQGAAQAAMPVMNNIDQYLARTYILTESKVQRPQPNNLPPNRLSGQPLRRLFI